MNEGVSLREGGVSFRGVLSHTYSTVRNAKYSTVENNADTRVTVCRLYTFVTILSVATVTCM
jgi:hypothetical protein